MPTPSGMDPKRLGARGPCASTPSAWKGRRVGMARTRFFGSEQTDFDPFIIDDLQPLFLISTKFIFDSLLST